MIDASQSRSASDARRRQKRMQQGIAGSVRNVGGARGLATDTETEQQTQRALKAMTGQ